MRVPDKHDGFTALLSQRYASISSTYVPCIIDKVTFMTFLPCKLSNKSPASVSKVSGKKSTVGCYPALTLCIDIVHDHFDFRGCILL